MEKKRSDLISVLLFCACLGGMLLLFLLLPARGFSEQENRMLSTRPRLERDTLLSGEFMEDFEDYLIDQFPGRDSWMDLKSLCERLLLKQEYNGVYLCADGSLITRFDAPDRELLGRNLNAVNALAEESRVPVYFMLIPSAASVWEEKLPPHAPSFDQRQLIRELYAACAAVPVDAVSVLDAHREEEIFYRTDHHWTSLGAYYGYTAFAKAAGFEPAALESFRPRVVSEDFRGTVWSRSGVHWTAPDRITLYVEPDGVQVTNYPEGKAEAGQVYDFSRLETKDQYALFYGGNTPRLVIRTGAEDGPKLLVIRDSYMDSASPFLFPHFSEIHMLDLRYYRQSVQEYLRENDIDLILLCYNITNFVSETTIVMASA